MKFDLVIGNPPYSRDVYVDFVLRSNKLFNKYMVMLTPAKWKFNRSKKHQQFRQEILPYISEVVYYPDCLELFNISECSGITYYIVGKQLISGTRKCKVVNINNYQPLINSTEFRDISSGETLWNVGNQIVKKLASYKTYTLVHIPDNKRLRYTVNISTMWRGSRVASKAWDFERSCLKEEFIGKGGVVFTPEGNMRIFGKIKVIEKDEGYSDSSMNVFTSDNMQDILYYESWIKTKFIGFLVLIAMCSTRIMNRETWRFVPDPGNFDHIFTDVELYKRYGLSDKDIYIVESLMKEFKKIT